MILQQHLTQTQKLILTQTMQQSLQCLQMSALELHEFLQDQAQKNPLLDLEEHPFEPMPMPEEPSTNLSFEHREQFLWESSGDPMDLSQLHSRGETFVDHLLSQLGQMPLLSAQMRALCEYLVGCLNSSGYLDCPLAEIAQELDLPLFDIEQALFVIQSLEPTGVGARNLHECLLLQLVQSKDAFTEVNLRLIGSCLELLAQNKTKEIANALQIPLDQAQQACTTIRNLNPIPSRGFDTGNTADYIIPEATITTKNEHVIIELNGKALPKLSLNGDYCAMLEKNTDKDVQTYLKENLAGAKGLLSSLENRGQTIKRMLEQIVSVQQDFFLRGGAIEPMTMQNLAQSLDLNVSTISRAVKGKYIQVNGKAISLRTLFAASVQTNDGEKMTANTVRAKIKQFIDAEPPHAPLSDQTICNILEKTGIQISRRTVAKYRSELNIPSASLRRST